MIDDTLDVTEGGNGASATSPAPAKTADAPEVTDQRAALVKDIIKDAKDSYAFYEDQAFKRMRECMKLAAHGTVDKERAKALNGAYVVPILNRYINQAVAGLYAKNPKAVAQRKEKLYYKLWDGDPQTLQATMAELQQAAATPAQVDPMTGQPMADPQTMNSMAMMQEIETAKQEMVLYERMGRTMSLLFAYFLDEQDAGYKEQFKALVRRTKVTGVGWAKLGLQRIMQLSPDQEARIADSTQQIVTMEAGLKELADGDIDEASAKMEELRLLIQQIQASPDLIVREGPVYSFPRSTEVFPDRRCRHLKTLAGTRRLFQQYDMLSEEILEVYGVDVGSSYTAYDSAGKTTAGDVKSKKARVWEVQDKKLGQVYTVCDGYPDFLKVPAEPDVKIDRFWTLFPLVFNEIESDEEIYPPSDVWAARHMQAEYNLARQGMKDHRIAARPRPVAARGKLEDSDKKTLAEQEAFELIEINAITAGEKVNDVIGWLKLPGVDPNLYETETTFSDILRSVGAQEANFGGTSNSTATETSIAEQGRMSTNGSDVDDLENLLTALARATGQLMLQELSKDMVVEIVGPGAVWPDTKPSREDISKELLLGIEAGSNGRPNKAAELANMERAMPYLTLIPGIKPTPIAKKYLGLLDIDVDDTIAEGLPSITAMNQMANHVMQAGNGPNAPQNQGDKGANNAPGPNQANEPQSQPAFPTANDAPAPI